MTSIDAGEIFAVKGLVAVITGGGSGMSSSLDSLHYATQLESSGRKSIA